MDMSTGTGTGPDPMLIPPVDRVVGESSTYRPRAGVVTSPSLVGENLLTVRNRIQWGPVTAGVVTALATFLLLTVLGIALGASVLEPRDTGEEIGRWAAIWGAFSVIAAFVLGGWMASRSAAVEGSFAAMVNGFITGAAGLLLVIWLSLNGLGNLFGTLGSGVGAIAESVSVTPAQVQQATGAPVATDPQAAVDQAGSAVSTAADEAGEALARADTPQTFEAVRNGAIGTFLGLLLPLVAAMLGGWFGKHTRQELVTGSGVSFAHPVRSEAS